MAQIDLLPWLQKAQTGDTQAFAQLLTQIEKYGPACLQEPALLEPQHLALRIGITGPPGAGKSTLIGNLIGHLRQRGLKVGVLAVDPSSPFSMGAILGDRIRYSEHFLDPQVFIRSLGTRGSLGGLSSSAYLMLRAFDTCNFDVVVIETVGVGQTELEIVNVADQICVVLVPESGDSIQAMKAGLLEIADIYVVNKADRPGAESMEKELMANFSDPHSAQGKPVVKTVASEGKGISDLTQYFLFNRSQTELRQRRFSATRLQQEAFALMRSVIEQEAKRKISHLQTPQDLARLFSTVSI